MQTVDVRDVAWACAAATTADVAREILLIAGDESHRRCYGDLAPALVAALGMPGAIPPGRPGNPDSDTDWFVTDWMDTTRAQEALQFQHYSWSDMMAELSREVLVEALSGAADRADRSRGDEAPVGPTGRHRASTPIRGARSAPIWVIRRGIRRTGPR